MNPRHIILCLPALVLVFLLILWSVLARWSGGIGDQADALRRQLQAVRMAKPALQVVQAGREERQAITDQNPQGVFFAIMEATLRANGLGDAVRQIRPELREFEVHVEEQLSLTLTQLDSSQMALFLYETQKAMPEMIVDSLTMRRNNDGFMDIDAVFLLRRPK